MLQRLMRPDSTSKSGESSALYVDVENLREGAQAVIEDLLGNWPSSIPPAGRLCLYVPAENLDLWEMWAKSHFPGLAVVVKGVQHYSFHPSKNAADMAIAMDALSDLILRRANHLVVLSDDSDFIALYAKVKEVHEESGREGRIAPFLWVLTDRKDTRSGTIRDYFPNDHVYVTPYPNTRRRSSPATTPTQPAPRPARQTQPPPRPARTAQAPSSGDSSSRRGANDDNRNGNLLDQMAETIIREMPIGFFGSADCQKIVKKQWPDHSLAKSTPSGFGTKFANSILPVLKKRGVTEPNPNRRPRRYEMTKDAKLAEAR